MSILSFVFSFLFIFKGLWLKSYSFDCLFSVYSLSVSPVMSLFILPLCLSSLYVSALMVASCFILIVSCPACIQFCFPCLTKFTCAFFCPAVLHLPSYLVCVLKSSVSLWSSSCHCCTPRCCVLTLCFR